jgi:PKD repeat protein
VVLTIAAPGVLSNDINPGVGITFTAILVANPSNGAVSLSSDGSFVYTPTVNFFGNDSFTYRAYDGINNSNIGTVIIDVLPINDAPIAVDDQATTTENTQAIINVLSNDIDVDITDIFTVTAVTQPTNGTTTINAGNTVTYSPTLNFNGLDIFTYTVSDGVLSDTAVVTVTVNPVNTIPQVTVAVVSPPALEGTPTQFLGTVFDPDGRPQFIPSGSTIEWDFGDGFNSSGTLTPTHTYNDNGTYTVTLTVTDAQGGIGSDTLILAVENVAPIVNAGPNQSVPENTNVSFNGSYNDPGLFDSQTIAWDFGDGTGDVDTLNPSHTYNAAGVYTVILTVTDNDGGIGTDQLIVSVGQVATIYLPLITNGNLSAPDLVIESVSITADNATIVIKNTGDQAVADGFWVDLYINPTPPPTAANQTWDQLSDEGIVWGITQIASLVPGGTLTIDLNHSSLNAALTNFSGTFTNGMEIYVQVDSADIARQTGGVLEIHEITNGAYNNIVHVTAAIGQ